jgi:hypothetical protein
MSSYPRGPGHYHSTLLRRFTTALGLLALLAGVFTVPTRAQTANEYQVKAAFILNFARFIEWPGDALTESETLVIGVVGDDPFGSSIDQVVSRATANGRRLMVRRMRWGDNLRACQILFISSSERKRVGQILDAVRGSSVLTIAETSDFNRMGGMIKFFIHDNKVFFEINSAAAAQARLKVSSKLMALSRGGR